MIAAMTAMIIEMVYDMIAVGIAAMIAIIVSVAMIASWTRNLNPMKKIPKYEIPARVEISQFCWYEVQ